MASEPDWFENDEFWAWSFPMMFPPERFAQAEAEVELFQHRAVSDDWTRLEAEWTLVLGSTAQRYGFCVRIYSGSELKQMLRAAGFASVQLFGDLGGSPYDMNARRLVALATR